MVKRALRAAIVQAALVRIAGRYLAFALDTTRWTVHGQEHLLPLISPGASAVIAFWHERLPLMPALWSHASRVRPDMPPVAVLVSRHADGRLIGRLMDRFGLRVLHGSSDRAGRSRGGVAAVRALLEHLRAGGNVVITPDGPRGPRRVAASGVAQVAALAGARVLPCAAQTSRRRTLATWDRMILPLPWGRGVIVCGPAIDIARDGIEAGLVAVEAALSAAADAADRHCVS